MGNDVVVEDRRMGSALGKDFTSLFQKFRGHILSVAKSDGGIDESDIGDHLHTHFGQLVCDGIAETVSAADHIAAGKTVGDAHIDLNAETVKKELCALPCERAVLNIFYIIWI